MFSIFFRKENTIKPPHLYFKYYVKEKRAAFAALSFLFTHNNENEIIFLASTPRQLHESYRCLKQDQRP